MPERVLFLLMVFVLVTNVVAAPAYPLKKSPNGRYLVEIEASSPDTGQTGRVITTFAVTR